jgi:heme/copper-type cytochrome/quinol oxidase subunit 3
VPPIHSRRPLWDLKQGAWAGRREPEAGTKAGSPDSRAGMLLFVLGEAVFFFLLIVAYLYFRNASAAAASLHLNKTAIFTACLLASSFTMWRANAAGLRSWVMATIVFGLVFLIGQGSEYVELLRQHVSISQSLFGTTFFTLTAFHGLHVAIGLIALATVLAVQKPRLLAPVSLFWQFGSLVWVAIFSVVYLGNFV